MLYFLFLNKPKRGHSAESRGGCHRYLSQWGLPVPFPPQPLALSVEKSWEQMGSVLTVGGTVSATPCAWVIHGSCMHNLQPGMPLPPRKGINTLALRAWGLDSVSLVATDQPPQANQMTLWLSSPGRPALGSSELPWQSLRKGCLSSCFGCLVALRLM